MALAHMKVPRQLFFRDPFLALSCGFAVHTLSCGVNCKLDIQRDSDKNQLCAHAAKLSKTQKNLELSGEIGPDP